MLRSEIERNDTIKVHDLSSVDNLPIRSRIGQDAVVRRVEDGKVTVEFFGRPDTVTLPIEAVELVSRHDSPFHS